MTGKQLRRWRRQRRLTLEKVGWLLGLAPSTLSRYERDLLEIPRPVELAIEFMPLVQLNAS